MLKLNDEQALQEVERPQFAPGSPERPADNAFGHGPPWKGEPKAKVPAGRERPADKPRQPELPAEPDEQPTPPGAGGKESRKSFRRRHPIAATVGSALFVLAVGGGYLYWSYG